MSFNKSDISRNMCQLTGSFAKKGYDWWWHSFTGISEKTGEQRAFFVEFFLCNPALGGKDPLFGQKSTDAIPSYLMVKAGAWGQGAKQLHRFFSWDEAKVDFGCPYKVTAADCLASEERIKGSVKISEDDAKTHPEWMCNAGEIEWDLKIQKDVAFNVGYGAGKLFRKMKAFEMFWHAEGMKSEYDGYVIFEGERYKVSKDTSYGYADKNWGRDFTSPWVWLSSNNLVSEITGKKLEDSVFDIGGGKPKVGPLTLKGKLLSAFWYEGKAYEFNFSKFWTATRTKFDCRETDTQIVWHVEQKTWCNKMVTDMTCDKSDMLLVNYESPDGKKRHNRLWNGGNGKGTVELYRHGKLVDRIRVSNAGCEWGEYSE